MINIIKCSVIALAMLTGCASHSGSYEYSSDASKKTDVTFVGIPTALGIGVLGTTFPVTENLSLTAKHVAHTTLNSIVSDHPECDVALIKHNNKGSVLPKFKNANLGDSVRLYGHSAITAMPVESKGVALKNYSMQKCIVVSSDAGVVQGMSGGPVYSDDGYVVGVIIAVSTDKGSGFNSIFVPYLMFKDWLHEVTMPSAR